MALVGRLKDEHSLSEYFLQIDALTFQFKSSFLKVNTTETKELTFGGGRTTPPLDEPELLHESLSFYDHVDYVYKGVELRHYIFVLMCTIVTLALFY